MFCGISSVQSHITHPIDMLLVPVIIIQLLLEDRVPCKPRKPFPNRISRALITSMEFDNYINLDSFAS